MPTVSETRLGASASDGGECSFLVWAPRAKTVDVHLLGGQPRLVPLEPCERGYFYALVENVPVGSWYRYRLDGGIERPDPASAFQPEGVHGASQVVDGRFDWTDGAWPGLSLRDYALYEIHVGTFTPEGTFDAIIPRLPDLKALGVTAIELMPVAQFPGSRNWGYDGVYMFATQNSYGGPRGLQRLVNSCHAQGMAVVLDVVYNHLGPEGNYLGDFGFYYTDAYKTPWGAALNFDQEHSDEVRRYFIENALCWITDFHMDGLRLDAVHAIADPSARPFIQELTEQCHQRARDLKREVQVMAENNRNDPRVVWPCDRGGWALDSQWNDDFHHSLRVALTNEKSGYYQDFGGVPELAKALREGFVYAGEYSKFRKRRHGASSRDLPGEDFVVFAQNHDQVGNRRVGDRLAAVACFEQLKLAAATVLLSPYVPLLFMGEEYGEKAPFQYFVSHGDTRLIEAVRRGREQEFASFRWGGELPDPQDGRTYQNSKLRWGSRHQGEHGVLLGFYRELFRLRREIPALAQMAKHAQEVAVLADNHAIFLRRWVGNSHIAAAFHFAEQPQEADLAIPSGSWRLLLDSSEGRWNGPGGEFGKVVKSSGSVQLVLKPWSVLLWVWL